MSTLPEARRPTPPRSRLADALLASCRPLLQLSFALYLHEVRRDLYPRDELVTSVDGFDPQSLLFIGDVATSGHGVLSHGLTVVSQTANDIVADSGRGATISVIAEADLRLAGLVSRRKIAERGVEVAFLLVGVPDVLLLTSAERWAADLTTVVRRIQDESGNRACRVLVAELPPLAGFRPINHVIRRLVARQVDRLNDASARVAASTPGMTYVPFPTGALSGMYVKQTFSWKTLHETWAQSLAAALRDAN